MIHWTFSDRNWALMVALPKGGAELNAGDSSRLDWTALELQGNYTPKIDAFGGWVQAVFIVQ
jgi:hypothetical protein